MSFSTSSDQIIIAIIISNYHLKLLSIFLYVSKVNIWIEYFQSVYLKCHFVFFFFVFFLISWNTKLEIQFWFSFLYWSCDIKHKSKWFFHFQNNWTLTFKFEVRFSFVILIWKTRNQIHSNKYLMKLVTISPYTITINKYSRIK